MNNIVIYATCQGDGIKNYIKYYFPKSNINVIRNYQLVLSNGNKLQDFRNLLQKTNIFIYQEMPRKWGSYSTDLSVEDNLLNYVSNDCIKITIPYVYADWFWGIGKILLADGTPNFNTISKDSRGNYKYINKEIITNLKKSNYTLDNILKLYDDNKLDFNYEERKIKGINILKSKETTCDVKISDFILKNYKKQKLFYMPNHPTHIILKEMSKQILEKLNIDYNNFDTLFKNNNYNLSCEIPVSKYDKNYHNYEFEINCEDTKIKAIIVEIYKYAS